MAAPRKKGSAKSTRATAKKGKVAKKGKKGAKGKGSTRAGSRQG